MCFNSQSKMNSTPRSRTLNLLCGTGFNTGRLLVKSKGFVSQKNPFFAPTIFLQPQLYVKHFRFSIKTEYQFDLSKVGWRSLNITKETAKFYLTPLRQSALIVNISIGWVPWKKS